MTLQMRETRKMKGETGWAMEIGHWGLSEESCVVVHGKLKCKIFLKWLYFGRGMSRQREARENFAGG